MLVPRRFVRMATMVIILMPARPTATMVRNGSSVASLSVPVRGTTAIIDPASILDPRCMPVAGTVREVMAEDSTGVLPIDPTAAADTLTMASRTGRWVAPSGVAQVASTAAGIAKRRDA